MYLSMENQQRNILIEIGIQNQYNKHNQLSRGQYQTVSIALELVNEPEIFLDYNIYHLLF